MSAFPVIRMIAYILVCDRNPVPGGILVGLISSMFRPTLEVARHALCPRRILGVVLRGRVRAVGVGVGVGVGIFGIQVVGHGQGQVARRLRARGTAGEHGCEVKGRQKEWAHVMI